MTTQSAPLATESAAANAAELTPVAAWSRRVRRIGGFIQTAFAAFWLTRASQAVGGGAGDALIAASGVAVIGVLAYAIRVTAGTAPRPTGPEASRIGRSVTVATVIQLAASFVLPLVVTAAGHPGWVLPSIVITIGPLLLWLDHLVDIPRLRPVGWAMIAGPVILVAAMSGPALAMTTGIAAGVLLLGVAAAGFHDLAGVRPGRRQAWRGPARRTRLSCRRRTALPRMRSARWHLSPGDYRDGDLLRPGTLTRARHCGKVVHVDHRVPQGAVVAITAILDLRLKADSLETAHQVIHSTLAATRAFPGCLEVTVLVDSEDPAHVVLYETWESIEHDQAYRAWRASAEGASGLGSILATAPTLGRFTIAEGV